jgi:hypothetical protein
MHRLTTSLRLASRPVFSTSFSRRIGGGVTAMSTLDIQKEIQIDHDNVRDLYERCESHHIPLSFATHGHV